MMMMTTMTTMTRSFTTTDTMLTMICPLLLIPTASTTTTIMTMMKKMMMNRTHPHSKEEESYNYNPNLIIDMYSNVYTVDVNDVFSYADDDDKPITIQATQRQNIAILTANSIMTFTEQAKLKYDEFFLSKTADCTQPVPPSSTPMYAKNNDHDGFLYHRWNKTTTNANTTTIHLCTNKPRPTVNTKTIAHTPTAIPVKDDPSVTPTPETLCTFDTCSSNSTTIDNDAILNIKIWIQPISFNSNRSQEHHSTTVQYALIGVYDKLLNPSKLPCLFSIFNSIIQSHYLVYFAC